MFAVISSKYFKKEIESVVQNLEQEILFQNAGDDIDILQELEKISRIHVKVLILDISIVEDENKLLQGIRKYRLQRENTRIIIIAPKCIPGNVLMSNLFVCGIYDFINPNMDENSTIENELIECLSREPLYSKGIKWQVEQGSNVANEKNKITKTEIKEKIIIKEEIKEVIKPVEVIKSVFKQIITVYSPLSQGTSFVAAHLAATLAQRGEYRVCVVDFNVLKPWQKKLFNIDNKTGLSELLEWIVKDSATSERINSCVSPSKFNKKLDILTGIEDINDYYTSDESQYENLLEKIKVPYDYVIIDVNSFADIFPTHVSLRLSEKVVVPVNADKYSLELTQKSLKNFEKYGDYDLSKFSLLINNYGPKDLTFIEVDNLIQYPLLGYIKKYKDYECFQKNQIADFCDVILSLGISVKKKKGFFGIKGGM